MWKQALVALAVALVGVSAPSAAVAQTETVDTSERAFFVWMQPIMRILDRTTAVNDALVGDWGGATADAEGLRRALAARERARGYRVLLAELQAELQTISRFDHPAAPSSYSVLADTLLRDTAAYLRNMDDMLAHLISFVDAIEADDSAAIERIAPRLLQSAVLLLEGQIVTVRARQQLVSVEDTAHHALGAMLVLYEGMRAAISPNVVDRGGVFVDLSQAAARWSASGRQALAAERTRLPELATRERALLEEMLRIEERTFAVNDRVVGYFEAAARSQGNERDMEALVDRLVVAEADYLRLNQRMMQLLTELAAAGVEL